jgi:superoxide dismutase, Fe-Mn family
MEHPRRKFIKTTALLSLGGLASGLFGKQNLEQFQQLSDGEQKPPPFVLPELPYAYDALEPVIDKETMMLHHDKHHKAYVDKLNKALENYTGSLNFKELFASVSTLDVSIRNNGGGHFNHSLFWMLMKAPAANGVNAPQGALANALKTKFGNPDNFRMVFGDQALKIFGSGWCWLVLTADKDLQVCTTPNQDNPLMDVSAVKGTPILALDVWEHAYYLKYQNKRADYIKNWWSVVNWERAEGLYQDALSAK